MDQQIEDRIRQRAYGIWEAEGRPEGQDLAHWAQAVAELMEEGAANPTTQAPGQESKAHGVTVAPTPDVARQS